MNGAQALIRTLVDCGVDVVLRQPGHVGDALRRRARRRARDARRARALRGRRDRRRRRVRPHGRPARGDAAAPRARARQRARQPAQRPASRDTRRQHRRRPRRRTTSSTTRRSQSDIETVARNVSGWVRTSSAATDDVGADAADAVAAAYGPPGQVATLVLPADVSWCDGGRAVAPPQAGAAPTRDRRRGRARSPTRCGPASRPRCCSAGAALPRGGPARRALGSPTRPGAKLLRRDLPGPARAGRRAACRSSASATSPSSRRCSSTGCATSCSSTRRRRCRSSPIPASPATWCPDGCEVHTLATGDDDAVGALEALADVLGATGERPDRAASARGPSRPDGTADRGDASPPRSARCCPRARSCPTRATRSGLFVRRRHRGRAAARLAHASPAARSARGCRSPSAPPSRAPTGR